MANEEIEQAFSCFKELIALISALRGENGCPWDLKQTPRSMITQLIEETYELLDAIHGNDPGSVCEELGDVLFHVFFLAHLYQEEDHFNIQRVTENIVTKMIRRHPHVFGDKVVQTAEEVRRQWYAIKKDEKKNAAPQSTLDSVSSSLPALMRAYRMSERAARAGFDWDDLEGVFDKVEEEWREFKTALLDPSSKDQDRDAVAMEFGDLLFTLTNVARFLRINPESALTEANKKFQLRFSELEKRVATTGRDFSNVGQNEKDQMWEQIKKSNF